MDLYDSVVEKSTGLYGTIIDISPAIDGKPLKYLVEIDGNDDEEDAENNKWLTENEIEIDDTKAEMVEAREACSAFLFEMRQKGITLIEAEHFSKTSTDIHIANAGDFLTFCTTCKVNCAFYSSLFDEDYPLPDTEKLTAQLGKKYDSLVKQSTLSDTDCPKHYFDDIFNELTIELEDYIDSYYLFLEEEVGLDFDEEPEPILTTVFVPYNGVRVYFRALDIVFDLCADYTDANILDKFTRILNMRIKEKLELYKTSQADENKKERDRLLDVVRDIVNKDSTIKTLKTQKARTDYTDRLYISLRSSDNIDKYIAKKDVRSIVDNCYFTD